MIYVRIAAFLWFTISLLCYRFKITSLEFVQCVCVCVCMRVMYFIVHYHSHMVLDEADQMLERGFAESVEEVLDEVFHDSKNCKCHVFA